MMLSAGIAYGQTTTYSNTAAEFDNYGAEDTVLGETFVAPVIAGGTTLEDFTFYLDSPSSQGSGPLEFELYQWNAATDSTVGNALYTSDISGILSDPLTVSLDSTLIAGDTYVMLVSQLDPDQYGIALVSQLSTSSPLDGAGYFLSGSDATGYTSGDDMATATGGYATDLTYSATFSSGTVSAVPDTGSTFWLLGIPVVGMCLVPGLRKRTA
jgi:hypothetical protein